jgi:HAD superfamily hydrolase (TIGR01509 family)
MIQGVLFDMDGVLIDSEAYIAEAAVKMFEEYGINAKTSDFKPYVGMGENKYIGNVAEKYGLYEDIDKLKTRTYNIYDELISGKVGALPGVHVFIDKCKKKGLKIAVATSADKMKMIINLKEIGLADNIFDALVNGLDIEHKKPDPEIYLLAAKKCGINIANCLVVEDAISGVEAGKRAGAKVLGLTTSFTGIELEKSDWLCNTLADAPDEALEW